MIGTRLGPYRIDRELGAGGMGKVYAATVAVRCAGLSEGAQVALKVVHPHLLETPGFFKRFLREAEIGRSVEHDNVVRTFDCDQVVVAGTHHCFLTMEYVAGQTLRELLDELERVPEELCRHVAREVCRGLAAIHAQGVVHRDVKPDNVLITADHVVKVMDLGVARLTDEALRLSQTGAFVGSIHYAAPECFRDGGRDVDGRADLHALGLVLYEMSCGHNPYLADTVPEILRNVLHEEPRRLGEVNPQLSPFFEEVVHNLLAKRPDDRFADARTLLGVLEQGENSSWWKARSTSIRATTQRPLRRIRIPRETAVYGRENEIGTLTSLFDQARAGEGRVILVEGEAGIGKSRLVDELVSHLERRGEDLNFLFGSYPPGGAATASGAFSSAFHEHFGGAGAGPWLRETPLLVPAFDALLKGDAPPSGAQALTKDSLGTCFVRATRGLAAQRTTVVLIDDLHFAPPEALALFTTLAMATPGHRILLIGSTRPGLSEEWRAGLSRLPHAVQLAVPRLGPKHLVELLQDSFKSEALASSLAAQVALKSDGNPFFAFEIIRGLREGQFITQRADGTWVTTRVIEDIQIPSSLLDLVSARVATLSQEERDVLDVAACWGFEFDPGLIADVLGTGRIPLLKRLAQIERGHRLVRACGRAFAFDHHQVQEALYASLPEMLREEYHAALAEALAAGTGAAGKHPEALDGALCVDLCEHYLSGALGAQALRYLDAAQQHLVKGHVHAQLVALTERALAVPDLLTGVERAKMLLRLAASLDPLGRRERQEQCAREAERLAEEAGDTRVRAQAARALGMAYWRTSRDGDAEAAFLRTLAIAEQTGDQRAELVATGSLGLLCLSPSRHAEAQALQERALELSREIGDRYGEAIAMGNLGNVFCAIGRLVAAQAQYERSLALGRELGRPEVEAVVLVNLGPTWLALGDLRRAREALRASLALDREIGERFPEAYALHGLGTLSDEEGDAVGALTRFEESLALRREIGHGEGITSSLLALGDLRRRIGDPDGARAAFEEAVALSRGQAWNHRVAFALASIACLPGGDAQVAIAALADAGDSGDSADLRLLLWEATQDRAHLERAKRQLDEELGRVPEEYHAAMLTNLRVNREIVAACTREGL